MKKFLLTIIVIVSLLGFGGISRADYKPGTIVVLSDSYFNFGGIGFPVDLFFGVCQLMGRTFPMIGTHSELILEEDGTCISATQGEGVRISNIDYVLQNYREAIFIEVDLTLEEQIELDIAAEKYLGLPYGHNTYNGAAIDFLVSFFLQFCSDDLRFWTTVMHDADKMVCSEVAACAYQDIGISVTLREDCEFIRACSITSPTDFLRAAMSGEYPYMHIEPSS